MFAQLCEEYKGRRGKFFPRRVKKKVLFCHIILKKQIFFKNIDRISRTIRGEPLTKSQRDDKITLNTVSSIFQTIFGAVKIL